MIRLFIFLFAIGAGLWAVARLMASLRDDEASEPLPPERRVVDDVNDVEPDSDESSNEPESHRPADDINSDPLDDDDQKPL